MEEKLEVEIKCAFCGSTMQYLTETIRPKDKNPKKLHLVCPDCPTVELGFAQSDDVAYDPELKIWKRVYLEKGGLKA